MRPDSSTPPTRRRSVSKDELLELYQAIKSADTIGLYDAAEAIGNHDVATAYEKLEEAKTRYERRHARALAREANLNPVTREAEKAEARRRKVVEAVEKLNEYLVTLGKNVKIQRAVPASKPDLVALKRIQAAAAGAPPKQAGVSNRVLDRFRRVAEDDSAVESLRPEYDAFPVGAASDIVESVLLAVRSKGKWHLLRSAGKASDSDDVELHDVVTEKRVVLGKAALVRAGNKGHALRLEACRRLEDEVVLDESELNVLWAVVRDTKLLPNASEITLIKKNEFQRRQYDRTLKKMLLLQRSFNAAAQAKRNEFRRELAMLEEQKLTMSLREVEKRKLRISQETRLIERAETHFTKVMNCLHALDSRRS